MKLTILALAGVLAAFNASAVTVDFNSLSGSLGSTYSTAGITFSTTGSGGLTVGITPNGTAGLLGGNTQPYQFIRADIAGDASFVSVDLGDYDQDADTIFLQVFDSANNSLGFSSQLLDASFTGMVTLNWSAANIAYAVFGSTAPSTGGSSVYADNFTTRGASTVPDASSTLGLLAAGLSTLGLAARRRKI